MTVVAENKRRVLAALLTMLVLLAVGFGIGRLTGGSNSTDASVVSTLRRELATERSSSSATAGALAAERARYATLSEAAARSSGQLATLRACTGRRRPQPFRQCVDSTLGR